MDFHVVPITEQDAEAIATWRYPSPYEIYSLSADVIPILLDPLNRYFAVRDDKDQLVGYCCFGSEARVIGGDYSGNAASVLDAGVGMRPDRVGKGEGRRFVCAVLLYAMKRYILTRFRVTIAEFNKRSLKTFKSLRFEETYQFTRPADALVFIQLERFAFIDDSPCMM